MHVCVFHPLNRDGELLTQQLQRIGCEAHCFWPPLDAPVQGSDLVFIGLYPDTIDYDYAWCGSDDAPPVVAVVNYENPTIIDAVLRIGAKAVVASPVRSFGVLSALVLAQQISGDLKKLKKRVVRLEEKVEGVRKIAEAQEILVRQRGISRLEAYRAIRAQAMAKRVAVEEIASAIIAADEFLSLRG
ncbi:Two component response regulator [Paraburkholderia caribensis MBA4]|uniref:Two component response regulator n=2 Tax=Paraburkholderia caribensis TaxID=75105 RepID=A0A0N7JV67_9BURK|nr:Two component response regulator [Paraburkholderia caribensis MBA4]